MSECSSFLVRCVLVEALAAPGLLAVTTRAGPFCGTTEPPLRHPWVASGRGQWSQLGGKGWPLFGTGLGTDSVPETVDTHADLRGHTGASNGALFEESSTQDRSLAPQGLHACRQFSVWNPTPKSVPFPAPETGPFSGPTCRLRGHGFAQEWRHKITAAVPAGGVP